MTQNKPYPKYNNSNIPWLEEIPPLSEQQQIVSFIEVETNLIETTISKIEKELVLVQEYKTTLIAKMVTGKIVV